MDTNKMRACALLLPPPGDKVVAECLNEIERLQSYIEMDANCPCCQQTYVCEDDCTFVDDAPDGYKQMMFAREMLTPNDSENEDAAV